MSKKVDEALVRKVAKLARLELTDDEVVEMSSQLSDIVGYVEKMNELDTEGVEPLAHCLSIINCFRDDEVKESLGTERTLENSPEKDEGYFRVPRILDDMSSAL